MYRSIIAIVLGLCLILAGQSGLASEARKIQTKISIDSKTNLNELLSSGLDIVYRGEGYIEIIASDSEIEFVQSLGFTTEIIHADVSEFYRSRIATSKGAGLGDMGGYKTLSEVYEAVDQIIADHPGIITTRQSIGTTIELRNQYAIKISDNPNVNEDEPEILFTAAIHAREVITPLVLLHFMNHLTDNYGIDPEITELVDTREIWFILINNPDGYYQNEVSDPAGGGMWRKNRRDNGDGTYGVDLNRNFGYMWGYDDIGSSPITNGETYRGTGPFSEPESQNIKAFIESHEFDITIFYHSYGNLLLWPWGYIREYTPDEAIFNEMGDSVSSWNGYNPGPGWILYTVNGDTDDWCYGEQTTKNKNFSFTPEVGSNVDGFWPDPSRIPQLISENLEPNLFLTRSAGNLEVLRPPHPPTAFVAPNVDSVQYDVTWTHDDATNPAVAYELTELRGPATVTDPGDNTDLWDNVGFVAVADRAYSATKSLFGGYASGLNNSLTSTHPFLVGPGDEINCQVWFDIETDWDYGYVEVSTDGISFTTLEGNITTSSNPNGNNRGHGITGNSSGWTPATFSLSAYVGQGIWIRLSYSTDGYVLEEGIYFDDISPVAIFASEEVISTDIPTNPCS